MGMDTGRQRSLRTISEALCDYQWIEGSSFVVFIFCFFPILHLLSPLIFPYLILHRHFNILNINILRCVCSL